MFNIHYLVTMQTLIAYMHVHTYTIYVLNICIHIDIAYIDLHTHTVPHTQSISILSIAAIF